MRSVPVKPPKSNVEPEWIRTGSIPKRETVAEHTTVRMDCIRVGLPIESIYTEDIVEIRGQRDRTGIKETVVNGGSAETR